MPISVLNAYWLAITQIEAEQTLLGIQVSSFPEYKKEDRTKIVRTLKNSAQLVENNRPEAEMTLEQLAVKLAGGG